jgi:hypothetical protein
MAGTGWTLFQKAIIIFFDCLLYTHGRTRAFLIYIAGNRRTLTAIRSQFAELKKSSALYDARKRRWTAQARILAYSERTAFDTKQQSPSN